MRRADSDNAGNTVISLIAPQPGPHRQAAHAVGHDDRRAARRFGDTLHGFFNDDGVVINHTEDRLQVNRKVRYP